MRPIQRLISAGFATAALASASVPAVAYTVWPDVNFEWYANVGAPLVASDFVPETPPRAGYIWAPGHWERHGKRYEWVAAHWVRDDYYDQLALYGHPAGFAATAPMVGSANIAPAYPVDTNRR